MTTADDIAVWGVVIFGIQAIIFAVQTYLLWWYASETRQLRLDAAEQNKLIARQIENAAQQNKLMTDQLKMMGDDLAFQKKTVEEDADPSLHFSIMAKNKVGVNFKMENIKKNVLFIEFRTNDPKLRAQGGEANYRHFSTSRMPDHQLYFSIVYRTLRDEVKAKTFIYFTGDEQNEFKAGPLDYNYLNLFPVGSINPK